MKILIVGLGSMGKRRLRNLQHLKAGEIFGYDPRPDRCQESEERHGIRTFSDFERAMSLSPDIMIVSTPPDLHTHYALVAARNNIHFFTEASVVDDGIDELIALCDGKSIVAAPSCTMRFNPSVRVIKDLVDGGTLGRVLTGSYHLGIYLPDWHPWEDYHSFYAAKKETGGCREMVPFELVWLTWVMGKVETVSGFKGKLSGLDVDVDDAYHVLFQFERGAFLSLAVDILARVFCFNCRLVLEKGLIDWTWNDKKVRVFSSGDCEWREYAEPEGLVLEGYIAAEEMYIEEMKCFLNAVKGEGRWPYTLREDRNILKLLYASEQSSEEGRHIKVLQ